MFHEIWELERFQTGKVTFKVIGNGNGKNGGPNGKSRFVYIALSQSP